MPCALRDFPATLIGNWEIAGIRSRDVSQSEGTRRDWTLKVSPKGRSLIVPLRIRRHTFAKMFDAYVSARLLEKCRTKSTFQNRSRALLDAQCSATSNARYIVNVLFVESIRRMRDRRRYDNLSWIISWIITRRRSEPSFFFFSFSF